MIILHISLLKTFIFIFLNFYLLEFNLPTYSITPSAHPIKCPPQCPSPSHSHLSPPPFPPPLVCFLQLRVFFKDFVYLFMRHTHTHTEREREAETQAEGEAGSMQGARRGTRSRVSRIRPWAEGGAKPLSHPGPPFIYLFILLMRDTERQKHRQREKQASHRKPDVGLDPQAQHPALGQRQR